MEKHSMVKYIIKRLIWMIPIIIGIIVIVFSISHFAPGDPVKAMLGADYTQEAYDAKSAELGLDRPFIVQLGDYIWNLVTKFDFGTSYKYSISVAGEISNRIGHTMTLAVFSILLIIVVGIPLGLLSATKQYTILDYFVTAGSTAFAAMPSFWVALMAMLLFALKLGWLPPSGIGTWKHWILPVITCSLTSIAVVARMTRSSMLEVIRQDYIRTARAKGLKESVIIRRHALKNALIPVITVLGMQFGMLMGGNVIIENIYTIPGLGAYLLTGISARDYPVINGCVLIIAVSVCVMNLVVDICYAYIDPRLKAQYVSSRKKKTLVPDDGSKREGAA
jgi:peptide/nickel transport system permease protein